MEGKRQISTMSADGLKVQLLTGGPVEHFHPAFSPDGRRISFTATENGSSRILVMDSGGSNPTPVTPPDQRGRWPAWPPDGKRIAYFVQGTVGEIWQVDVGTLERVKLFDSGLGATTLDWSSDGEHILFERGGLDILDLATHNVRRVLGPESKPGQPRWSPDGTRILFATGTGLAVLDLRSANVHALLH